MKFGVLNVFVVAVSILMAGCMSQVKSPIVAPPETHSEDPLTPQWREKIEKLAPGKATAVPEKRRRVLVFSLSTGYQHMVAPYMEACVEILGDKTGAYETRITSDVMKLTPDSLSAFDAVVLNNNIPKDKGDLFETVLGDRKKAIEMGDNLRKYVADGKGLVVLHSAFFIQNYSPETAEMIGGSYDFHPRRQEVTLLPVEPDHPLLAAFDGRPFVHHDEPIFFKGAYFEKNFRPLLEIDTSKLDEASFIKPDWKSRMEESVRYAAWIKPYGKGRVFYCGPSHRPESFETKEMLRFLLDGIQYAVGDLKCDDKPRK